MDSGVLATSNRPTEGFLETLSQGSVQHPLWHCLLERLEKVRLYLGLSDHQP